MDSKTMQAISTASGKVAVGASATTGVTSVSFLGMTVQQWQLVGFVSSIAVGVCSLIVMVVFKVLHYRLEHHKIHGDKCE